MDKFHQDRHNKKLRMYARAGRDDGAKQGIWGNSEISFYLAAREEGVTVVSITSKAFFVSPHINLQKRQRRTAEKQGWLPFSPLAQENSSKRRPRGKTNLDILIPDGKKRKFDLTRA